MEKNIDYKKIVKNEDLWEANSKLSHIPEVIRKEYDMLYESIQKEDVCRTIFRIKDLCETCMKIPTIISIIAISSYVEKENNFVATSKEDLIQEKNRQIYDDKKFSEKKESERSIVYRSLMSKLLKEPLSMGSWLELLHVVQKHADKFELDDNLRQIISRTIELLKTKPHKVSEKKELYENICAWRNKVIGHGTLLMDTDGYWQQIYDIIQGISLYIKGVNEEGSLDSLYEQISITGDDEIILHIGNKEYEIVEYLYNIEDDRFFFDSYFRKQRYVEVTNYINSSKRMEGNEHFNNSYVYATQETELKDLKKYSKRKIGTSEDREMYACLNNVSQYERPDFVIADMKSFMKKHSKGVLYLQMERGMGKSTLAHNLDGRYQKGILQEDLKAVVRVYHIRDTLLRTENRMTDFYTSLENNLKSYDCGKQLEVDNEAYDNDAGEDLRKLMRKVGEEAQIAFAKCLELYKERYEELYEDELKLVYIIDGIDELNTDTRSILKSLPSNQILNEMEDIQNVYLILLSRIYEEENLHALANECIKECEELSDNNTVIVDRFSKDYYSLLRKYIKKNYENVSEKVCSEIIEKSQKKFLYVQPYMAMGEKVLLAEGTLTASDVATNYITALLKKYWGISQNNLYLIIASIAVFGCIRLKDICELVLFSDVTYDVIGCLNDIIPLLTVKRTDGEDVYEYANEEYSKVVFEMCKDAISEVISRFHVSAISWIDPENWRRIESYNEEWAYYVEKILIVNHVSSIIEYKPDEKYFLAVKRFYEEMPESLYAKWIEPHLLIDVIKLLLSFQFGPLRVIKYTDMKFIGLETREPEKWSDSARSQVLQMKYEFTNKLVEHCMHTRIIDEWFKYIVLIGAGISRITLFNRIIEEWHDDVIVDYIIQENAKRFALQDNYEIVMELLFQKVSEETLKEKLIKNIINTYAIWADAINSNPIFYDLKLSRKEQMILMLEYAENYSSVSKEQLLKIRDALSNDFIFKTTIDKLEELTDKISQIGVDEFFYKAKRLGFFEWRLNKHQKRIYQKIKKKAANYILKICELENNIEKITSWLSSGEIRTYIMVYCCQDKDYVERYLKLFSSITEKCVEKKEFKALYDISRNYKTILRCYDEKIRQKSFGIYSENVDNEIDRQQKLSYWDRVYILNCSWTEYYSWLNLPEKMEYILTQGMNKYLQELYDSNKLEDYYALNARIEESYHRRNMKGIEYLRWITIRYYRSLENKDYKNQDQMYSMLKEEYDWRYNNLFTCIYDLINNINTENFLSLFRNNTSILFSFIRMIPDEIAVLDDVKIKYEEHMKNIKRQVSGNKNFCDWIDAELDRLNTI